jgi:sec-independent protein translocase protein TatB
MTAQSDTRRFDLWHGVPVNLAMCDGRKSVRGQTCADLKKIGEESMFGIAWSELLLIGVVALVVIPPKDLPTAMRMVGKWVGQMRRMAFDFQHQVTSALREAEFDDIKKSVTDLASQDIMADIRNELESAAAPVSQLEGQFRQDLSIEPEIKSFPSHGELDMGLNALPTSEAETSTPPGNAHMPGAMELQPVADPGSYESSPAFAPLDAEPGLEPIPVAVSPLPERLHVVEGDRDSHVTDPSRGIEQSQARENAPAVRVSGV